MCLGIKEGEDQKGRGKKSSKNVNRLAVSKSARYTEQHDFTQVTLTSHSPVVTFPKDSKRQEPEPGGLMAMAV